jgi:hypothetical protein
MVAIARGELFCFGIKHSRVKCPNFSQLKHGKLQLGACCGGLTVTYCGGGVGARLNYYCCCCRCGCYCWNCCGWNPILLLLWSTQLTPGGVYTMRYLGGAPLELPLPMDPGIILFLFFSWALATAFIILYWSMAALTNLLYDKLERCTKRSYRWMVSPAWYKLTFFSSVSTWYVSY